MTHLNTSSQNVAKHREKMRSAGLRPVQFWVPDTRSADFVAQLREQCAALKGDAVETDVLRFTEAAASQIEGWQ
jgi:hypothetical protein